MGGPQPQEKSIRQLQQEVEDEPYSIIRRLDLSNRYAALKYPDLAAGEAYLALLLCDEILDESGEYHEPANETAAEDIKSMGIEGKSASDWINDDVETTMYAQIFLSMINMEYTNGSIATFLSQNRYSTAVATRLHCFIAHADPRNFLMSQHY
jgi:hypothetical protein